MSSESLRIVKELPEQAPLLGFRFAACPAQIRKDGRADVALAVSDSTAVAAGVFTRNLVRAAPVELAEQRLRAGTARAVLVNSGCANACTGSAGLEAAQLSTRAVARELSLAEQDVLPASTGVIGALLPAARIEARAAELAAALSPDGWRDFAAAILTTDRFPKVVADALPTKRGSARLIAIAKGAGMIHPDLGPPHATMLAFVFIDAEVERDALQSALEVVAKNTFNAASVDGDTSTNDCVIALANGASGVRATETELIAALGPACDALACSMVADGEGAHHVAELVVTGLPSAAEAQAVARTVATSLLVKTALFGRDANWGRLLAAAGRAGVPFDPGVAAIRIGDVEIVRGGQAVGDDAERQAAELMKGESYRIELSLGAGPGRGRYLTSDLGHGYVDVNAGYRS